MSIGDLITQNLQELLDYIYEAFEDIFTWLIDKLSEIIILVLNFISQFILLLISKVPLPEFISDGIGNFSGLDCHLGWLLDVFEAHYALWVVSGALLYRVTIRMILR